MKLKLDSNLYKVCCNDQKRQLYFDINIHKNIPIIEHTLSLNVQPCLLISRLHRNANPFFGGSFLKSLTQKDQCKAEGRRDKFQ